MIQTPVHKDTDGWYFWDESWAERQGPFDTRSLAQTALETYCREVLKETDIRKTHTIQEVEQ